MVIGVGVGVCRLSVNFIDISQIEIKIYIIDLADVLRMDLICMFEKNKSDFCACFLR